ncbi:MAG: NTP transferase domain-containing protein [Anaerolineae bacterium]|nr:NTP transferase domain-containing protein [Anaerolineae bacterium]
MIDHAIIMAASPSRRMEPLTRTRPKAMLPVLGKPIIERVMRSYYNCGIRRFTVVVGEKEGSVVEWLSTKWYADADISFAPQGHRRGTASTLFATRKLIDGPFMIASCDNLVPESHVEKLSQYFSTHPSSEAALTLFYAPDEIVEAAGVLLDPRGHVMIISEEPLGAHQDYKTALPIFCFKPTILDYLDKVQVKEQSGESVLSEAIQLMIDDKFLVGALETQERHRLDTPEDLRLANVQMMAALNESAILSEIPKSTKIVPPVHIDPGVTVGKNVKLGPNVYLEAGSRIREGCVIRESVILGRQIGPNNKIDGEIIKGDRL